jgi:K+ transporter
MGVYSIHEQTRKLVPKTITAIPFHWLQPPGTLGIAQVNAQVEVQVSITPYNIIWVLVRIEKPQLQDGKRKKKAKYQGLQSFGNLT